MVTRTTAFLPPRDIPARNSAETDATKLAAGKFGLTFRLRVVLFVALTFLSAVPVLILDGWVQHSSMQKEIESVSEKHLIIANNLSAALSRYAEDVREGFKAVVLHTQTRSETTRAFDGFLHALGFEDLCIIDSFNQVKLTIFGDVPADGPLPIGASVMSELREIAFAAAGKAVFTHLIMDGDRGRLFVVQQLDEGRVALGEIRLNYIRSIQRTISFGKHGHSMIVDDWGRVMAHADPDWENEFKSASRVPVVRKMMAGETGVARFFSPPMRADMIAGYTSVPETGWGVMVPQPISELVDRAGDSQKIAILISVIGIVIASFIGWLLANYLARPIVAVEKAAGAVAAGRLDTEVDPLPKHIPVELHSLAASFDQMVDGLRRRDEELRVAMIQAEEASRSKSEFLAYMSHELQSPMFGIVSLSESMKDELYGPMNNSTYLKSATDIHRSGRHVLDLIRDVLDMAKIESGRFVAEFEDVDVPQVAQFCLDMVRNRAVQRNIKLVSDISDKFPPLRADGRMVKQILLNYLSNAVKFTPDGGTVSIAAVTGPDGESTIQVGDTGVGIAPKDLDRVMEPFSQVNNSLLGSREGAGLGLYLSKTMAELMGARQSIESQVGEGTTVTIRFPGPGNESPVTRNQGAAV